MKPLSIRLRLAIWYSLILALSLSLFGAGAYFAMRHSIYSTLDAELRQRIEGVRAIILEDAPHGVTALQDELREFSAGEGDRSRLRVVSASRDVLFSSPSMDFISLREPEEENSSAFNAKISGERFRVLHRAIEAAGTRYDVSVATSTKELAAVLEKFRQVLYLAIPALLVLAAAGGYLMSRRALAPVDEIARTARSIGAQNLALRLHVPNTGDELERLATTLNEMLARLDAGFQRVTQFTADASHELRTPVSVMRTAAELALRKPRSESEYRDTLVQIHRQAETVSQLIEQLLLLARADSAASCLAMSRTNLNEVLEKSWQQAAVLAEAKHLNSTYDLPSQPLWVRGDPASLERLFLILLDNAVKYTPEGGRIELRVTTDNGAAVAEVRDTGIGISTQDIPHVFDRFYRADRARSRETGGAGLGLSIGRWIAQAHGAEIRVSSEPAKGSSFVVRFPLSKD